MDRRSKMKKWEDGHWVEMGDREDGSSIRRKDSIKELRLGLEDKEMIKNLWEVVPGKGYVSGEKIAEKFDEQLTKDGQIDYRKQEKCDGYKVDEDAGLSAPAKFIKEERKKGVEKWAEIQKKAKPTRAEKQKLKKAKRENKIITAINLLSDACSLRIIDPGPGLAGGTLERQFVYFS